MTDEEPLGVRLHDSLEAHERELKRALESLGNVQSALESAGTGVETDGASREDLVDIGKQLEHHENRLHSVVETLDEHKRVLRDGEDAEASALAEAMERARQRARQENHPPDPTTRDDSG